MIRSQAVKELIVAAIERLLACNHECAFRAGKPEQCTRCGAVNLPEGLGWTLPTQLQSIQELIEAAREAEKELDTKRCTCPPDGFATDCPIHPFPYHPAEHPNRGC